MTDMLKRANKAKGEIASLDTEKKNALLLNMAQSLLDCTDEILKANQTDILNATGKINDVMIDRLRLDETRIKSMADGIRDVAALPDPVGKVLSENMRADGLKIQKVSVPLGCVAIIYESRPNVTADAAALTLKSGNVCVLRGGKEAINSAKAIVSALKTGIKKSGVCEDVLNLVTDTSRDSATALMTASGLIDLLIPRGGAGLINACTKNATVPCIQTGTGICHIYVDKSADFEMAVKIIENAKTSRPSVCNAEEVLLVDRQIAKDFLPLVKETLVDKRIKNNEIPVELRLDKCAAGIIDGTAANENDFDTEFLDYILAVGCVDGVEDAVNHIALHSTGHSEAIIAGDTGAVSTFTAKVDSAAVYVNASTRFTDGGEFGLGCEMGISTQKLHARGPMGLNELNTYKYIVTGYGNIR